MRFLKLTLILRDEVWAWRGAGCWDQGSNCPFCGLAFHLGCASRCGRHLRAHIFLFTLLWSCLSSHWATCRAFYCSWEGLRGQGSCTSTHGMQAQAQTQTIWVSSSFYGFTWLTYFCFLPSFPPAVLLFAPLKSGRKLN